MLNSKTLRRNTKISLFLRDDSGKQADLFIKGNRPAKLRLFFLTMFKSYI